MRTVHGVILGHLTLFFHVRRAAPSHHVIRIVHGRVLGRLKHSCSLSLLFLGGNVDVDLFGFFDHLVLLLDDADDCYFIREYLVLLR